MGRAGKWIRALLGLKKTDSTLSSSSSPLSVTTATVAAASVPKIVKNRWSFVKSYREKDRSVLPADVIPPPPDGESNKRAIAVAAATAVVAEAAVAAAQAAAEVVRLTSSGRSGGWSACVGDDGDDGDDGDGDGDGEELAALKIQAHFRAYLARRALRALRALVRLQALVRGNIVRKQTADMLKRMQTMLRVQERVRAGRAVISDSPPLSSSKSSLCPGPPTPEKFDHPTTTKSKVTTRHVHSFKHKRTGSNDKARFMVYQLEDGMWDHSQPLISFGNGVEMDGRMDKILEVDSGGRGTDFSLMRRTLFHHSTPNVGSRPHIRDTEESSFCSGNSSPQLFSAFSRADSSRRGSLTPTMSDGPKVRTDHRNYMSCTESSRAKTRSVSAPRQRSLQQYERSASGKRDSVCSPGYSGSGWLDGFGMPVG